MTKEEAIHTLLFEATHPRWKGNSENYKRLLITLCIDPELNIEQARVFMENVPVKDLKSISMRMFKLKLDVEEEKVEFNSNKPFGKLLEDIYEEVIESNRAGETIYAIHDWCAENLEGNKLNIAIHMLNGLYDAKTLLL